MARRELDVVIEDEGRDKGKVFHLTEMSASQTEDVAFRLLLALARAGVDVPQEIIDAGFAGLVSWGLRSLAAGVSFDEGKAIKDELIKSCVAYVPDRNHPTIRRGAGGIAPLVESDIEEVATRWELYLHIAKLHFSFFSTAVPSNSATAPGQTARTTLHTRTSPAPLAQ
jgi:hypothetical protein